MQKTSFSITMIAVACVSFADARVLLVPEDYQTIQEGIDAAVGGDTVLVAPGEYYEGMIDFNGKKITVAGHYLLTGDTSMIVSTVIRSRPSSDTVFSITFDSTEDSTTVLTGFTVLDERLLLGETSRPVIRDIVLSATPCPGYPEKELGIIRPCGTSGMH